jgi:hypothetical protein
VWGGNLQNFDKSKTNWHGAIGSLTAIRLSAHR